MTSLASLADYKAYHILSYGTFLGTTFFHSFVGGVVAYNELPRPMFARLMEGTFPFYFGIQTALPLAMMLTYPGRTVLQLGQDRVGSDTGITGLFKVENRWTAMLPLMTMLVSGAINTVILGPATTRTMKQRHHQGSYSASRACWCKTDVSQKPETARRVTMPGHIHQKCRGSTGLLQHFTEYLLC